MGSGGSLTIGAESSTSLRRFIGMIDELQIHKTELTPMEIASIASGYSPTSPSVALWKAENDATDSVLGHHGTASAGVTYAPGRFGQAFSFDGNSFIQVSPHADFDWADIHCPAVNAWIKIPSVR